MRTRRQVCHFYTSLIYSDTADNRTWFIITDYYTYAKNSSMQVSLSLSLCPPEHFIWVDPVTLVAERTLPFCPILRKSIRRLIKVLLDNGLRPRVMPETSCIQILSMLLEFLPIKEWQIASACVRRRDDTVSVMLTVSSFKAGDFTSYSSYNWKQKYPQIHAFQKKDRHSFSCFSSFK